MITEHKAPWLYYTVDNYFPADLFKEISYSIQDFIENGYERMHESQNGILQRSSDIINVIGNEALASFNKSAKDKVYNLYNVDIKEKRKYNEIKFMEVGGNYPIHDESLNKILSVVVYMYPIINSDVLGTKIYDMKKDYHSSIEWIPNRAMIFMRETGVSWHSYDNPTTDVRVTCNHFLLDNTISFTNSI